MQQQYGGRSSHQGVVSPTLFGRPQNSSYQFGLKELRRCRDLGTVTVTSLGAAKNPAGCYSDLQVNFQAIHAAPVPSYAVLALKVPAGSV
jgi:hypothetical protein